ncbi:hypothetical protein M8A51_08130 [Schlegelella sp. S2-27]|uniref:Uncharacterized protein n=1 Tax=Caldimonas mangrovi TaxID=2944811 RepID=A0ABT0YL86_9BURK|nr:hypothetical protein [Caldimonas mangrovi]MCM5679497.1 hypothetical protein [Caldimonas mangrovi]
MQRTVLAALPAALILAAGIAAAKLPPPSPEAQAQAAQAKAKADHTAKIDGYKLCLAQDRAAEHYRREARTQGKDAPAPLQTAACADPGPYAAPTPPLEQAGAHSPAQTAAKPHNSPVPQAPAPGK